MNWLNRIWTKEDELFSAKRKVNNRNSGWHPHIIGSFYSHKMNRPIEYESLGERLFYYFLELDKEVIRYYVQPVEVPIPKNVRDTWNHVPDVLVFRQGTHPWLYQIKHDQSGDDDPKFMLINKHCEHFAKMKKWNYLVIYPKTMSEALSRNLRFLRGFLRVRRYYQSYEESVVQRLMYLESCTVEFLAQSFNGECDPLFIKPLIYHLIAHGVFLVNVNEFISTYSEIKFNHQNKRLLSSKKEALGSELY